MRAFSVLPGRRKNYKKLAYVIKSNVVEVNGGGRNEDSRVVRIGRSLVDFVSSGVAFRPFSSFSVLLLLQRRISNPNSGLITAFSRRTYPKTMASWARLEQKGGTLKIAAIPSS